MNTTTGNQAPKKTRTRKPKADRFIELATKRVTVAIKAIRRIGGLSSYAPSASQIDDMLTTLQAELNSASETLHNTRPATPAKFTFSQT